MKEWKEYKLEEICAKITDGSHSSPKAQDSGYPMFSVKDMLEYGFDYSKCKYISREDFIALKNNGCVPQKGDVLVAKDGSYLKQIFVCKETKEEAILSSIAIFRPNSLVDSYFLNYLLKSPQVYNYIANNCVSGSALPRIVLKAFKAIKLSIPSFETQTKIVSVLKSLDNKIEANRRINDTLEQQAQALFKSWFVNFEPFKNQAFVDSGLGMIPEGWKIGTVGDICKFENGFAFKSDTYTTHGAYKVITIKNVQDGYLDSQGACFLSEKPSKMPNYCALNIGDILLSLTGNVGRCCLVNEDNLLLNQRVAKIRPLVGVNWGFIYTFFRRPDFKEQMISIARGTAQANLSPIETSKLKIIVPPQEMIDRYSTVATAIYQKLISNIKQSATLSSIRNTLLPRLMSGKLDVKDIERIL